MTQRPSIVVVGSLNFDYIARVARLPQPGETVPAANLQRLFGGKGANQAVAAARQGMCVEMIGSVGSDGAAYLEHLQREGVGIQGLAMQSDALTGSALIGVDSGAENFIIVAPEANGLLTVEWVRAQAATIASASVLLLQFEVPMPAIVEAVRIANEAGVPVLLNPSPLLPNFPHAELQIEYLIVNESEAAQWFSAPLASLIEDAAARRTALGNVKHCILTRGAQSTLCFTQDASFEVATLPVTPVDTVGAGDAFAGALAACIANRCGLQESITYANKAGALTTLKPGAQAASPTREEIASWR